METIYEVKQNTKEYGLIHNCFVWTKQFDNPDFQKEIHDLLGVPITSISTNIHRLLVIEIPKGLEKQFCVKMVPGKTCYFFAARQNSKINKAYLDLIKKYNIKEYRMYFFYHHLPYSGSQIVAYYSRIYERYFVICKDDAKEEILKSFDECLFLQRISNSTFYEMKAEFMKTLESEAKN